MDSIADILVVFGSVLEVVGLVFLHSYFGPRIWRYEKAVSLRQGARKGWGRSTRILTGLTYRIRGKRPPRHFVNVSGMVESIGVVESVVTVIRSGTPIEDRIADLEREIQRLERDLRRNLHESQAELLQRCQAEMREALDQLEQRMKQGQVNPLDELARHPRLRFVGSGLIFFGVLFTLGGVIVSTIASAPSI